jgi:hypothetical protein
LIVNMALVLHQSRIFFRMTGARDLAIEFGMLEG